MGWLKNYLRRRKYKRQLVSLIDNYLFFLENPSETVWGSITEEDEQGIERAFLLAEEYEGPVVEIGALFGHTTQLLATLKENDRKLIAVENYSWNPFGISRRDHRIITRRTLRYCMKNCSVEIFEGSNKEFYDVYNGHTPCMIFIDAGHTYDEVCYDIDRALKKEIPVICGHDYDDIHPEVKRAVDHFFSGKTEHYGSVWITKTTK